MGAVCLVEPLGEVGRGEVCQVEAIANGQGLDVGLANQLPQREHFDAQIVLCGDFLRKHEVKARLCLAGVGDGGGADLEVAFGRGQLFLDGDFLRLDELQAVGGS